MKSFIMVIICLGVIGCSKTDTIIYENQTFESIRNIAINTNTPFCIVLTDSFQNLSNEYHLKLQDNYKYLAGKAIYNLVDVNMPMNEWYLKWLCPVSTPLTCIFSPNGELIDLIPGTAKETFLYTAKAIKNSNITEFHWPNQFHKSKKGVIPLLNNLLDHKNMLDQGIYLSSELTLLVDSLYYPYSIYLKLLGESVTHDTIAAQNTAKSLIEFETPYSFKLYKTEFITAKKVLNPNFDVFEEANIRVDNDVISLSNCTVNKTIPIEMTIYNYGKKPLTISKIHTSCSCLEKEKNIDRTSIDANDSTVIKFYFTPDVEGSVSRDIYIASNAINIPILHINILANVVPLYKND